MLKRSSLKKKHYTLKKSPLKKISERGLIKKEEKAAKTKLRHQMFLEIWIEREEMDENRVGFIKCFETGRKLIREFYMLTTSCYHHILEKTDSKFPQYDLCKWNIVILHPDIHSQVHSNIDKTPKVKAETERLYQLHLNNEL